MEITFRTLVHTVDEVQMGQKIWFPAASEADAISATANSEGFTPLTAIARKFAWDPRVISQSASACNQRGEVVLLDKLSPRLLLVPKTKGLKGVHFLAKDLIQAANGIRVDVLNFTHFGFVQNRLPISEIQSIFDVILDGSTRSSIRKVIWDVDFRFIDSMQSTLEHHQQSHRNHEDHPK